MEGVEDYEAREQSFLYAAQDEKRDLKDLLNEVRPSTRYWSGMKSRVLESLRRIVGVKDYASISDSLSSEAALDASGVEAEVAAMREDLEVRELEAILAESRGSSLLARLREFSFSFLAKRQRISFDDKGGEVSSKPTAAIEKIQKVEEKREEISLTDWLEAKIRRARAERMSDGASDDEVRLVDDEISEWFRAKLDHFFVSGGDPTDEQVLIDWLESDGEEVVPSVETTVVPRDSDISSSEKPGDDEEAIEKMLAEIRGREGFLNSLSNHRRYVHAFQLASFLMASDGGSAEAYRDLGSDIEKEMQAGLGEKVDLEGVLEEDLDHLVMYRSNELLKAFIEAPDHPLAAKGLQMMAAENPCYFAGGLSAFFEQSYYKDLLEEVIFADPRYTLGVLAEAKGDQKNSALADEVTTLLKDSTQLSAETMLVLSSEDMPAFERDRLADIFPFLVRDNVGGELFDQILGDDHAYVDGLVYVASNDFGIMSERADDTLNVIMDERVARMNNLQESGDPYASIRGASVDELYATMAYGNYAAPWMVDTMFKELSAKMREDGLGSKQLVDRLGGLQFQQFAENLSEVGLFDEFLVLAVAEHRGKALIDRFISGITSDNARESLGHITQMIQLTSHTGVQSYLKEAIEREYVTARDSGDKDQQRAYGVLSSLFGEEATWLDSNEYMVSPQEKLAISELFDESGRSVSENRFYQDIDSDGHWSFLSWVQQQKQLGFDVEDHGTFIRMVRKQENRVVILYGNKPQASPHGATKLKAMDYAQFQQFKKSAGLGDGIADVPRDRWDDGMNGVADMREHMQANGLDGQILVHRGHSYWNQYTLEDVYDSTRLVIDGSCGGAGTVQNAIRANPDVQMLYTRGIGSTGINDTLVRNINALLIAGKDIVWSDLRSETGGEFGALYSDAETREKAEGYYDKYVFPDQKQGLSTRVVQRFLAGDTDPIITAG
ncbi:MAG: hypothetical protein O3B64_00970 [bacterium]|nr:hypothetical protein [bacterium]